jgi:outer membrane protein OmpA-like peptidoglycan-associated protein
MRSYLLLSTLLASLTILPAVSHAEPSSAGAPLRVAAGPDDDNKDKDKKDKKGEKPDRKPDRPDKADRKDSSDSKDRGGNNERGDRGRDRKPEGFNPRMGGRDQKRDNDKPRNDVDKADTRKNDAPPKSKDSGKRDDKRRDVPKNNDKPKDKGIPGGGYQRPNGDRTDPRLKGLPLQPDTGNAGRPRDNGPPGTYRPPGDRNDRPKDPPQSDQGKRDDRPKDSGRPKDFDRPKDAGRPKDFDRPKDNGPPDNAGRDFPRDKREAGGPRRGGRNAIEDIRRGRRERVEQGGKRTVIEEPDNRVIVKDRDGPARIRHNEDERMRRTSRDVRRERRPDGGNLTIAIRPGGIEIFSEFDSSGRLMRRYRRDRDGRDWDLIDNRRFNRDTPVIFDLRPPRLRIPRERYIVDYNFASDDDLYDALMDRPVDDIDRAYSLDEIRYNAYLRDRMRRVDLDTVTFDFGAWEVPYDQYNSLERIARTINRILDRRPNEVFLIEGHTDAVGSEYDNLTLSDRRAEEVAIILTETFRVPPENLVTQGYGEEFLKIPTQAPERANRRVAVRNITPLLARDR